MAKREERNINNNKKKRRRNNSLNIRVFNGKEENTI